jgi:hypothetical protein
MTKQEILTKLKQWRIDNPDAPKNRVKLELLTDDLYRLQTTIFDGTFNVAGRSVLMRWVERLGITVYKETRDVDVNELIELYKKHRTYVAVSKAINGKLSANRIGDLLRQSGIKLKQPTVTESNVPPNEHLRLINSLLRSTNNVHKLAGY